MRPGEKPSSTRREFLQKTLPVAGAVAMIGFIFGIRKCVESTGNPAEYLGAWESYKDDSCLTISHWPEDLKSKPQATIPVADGKAFNLLLPIKISLSDKSVCRKGIINNTNSFPLYGGIYEIDGHHAIVVWVQFKEFIFFGKRVGSNLAMAIRKNQDNLEIKPMPDITNKIKARKFRFSYKDPKNWFSLKSVNQ